MVQNLDEFQLCRQALEGDREAEKELLVRLGKCASYIAYHHIHNEALREHLPEGFDHDSLVRNNLLMEAEEKLLRNFNRFDGNNYQWRTYLYKTVYSQCRELLKDTRPRSVLSLQDEISLPNGDKISLEQVLEIIDYKQDPDPDPDQRLIAEEERKKENKIISNGLKMISQKCQKLIRLGQNELSHREIARVLKTRSEKQIGKLLRQCYDSLFKKILYLYVHGREADTKSQAIKEAIKKLSLIQQQVFQGWWERGKTHKALANELKMNPKEIKIILSKAKANIYRILKEAYMVLFL